MCRLPIAVSLTGESRPSVDGRHEECAATALERRHGLAIRTEAGARLCDLENDPVVRELFDLLSPTVREFIGATAPFARGPGCPGSAPPGARPSTS